MPTSGEAAGPHRLPAPSNRRGRRRRRWSSHGLAQAITTVAGRPVRSLSAGRAGDLPEVVLIPGLGAPGYLVPWIRQTSTWTQATILDLPGWRRGRARGCPPTVDGIARATVGWLAATNRRGIILLGHSTGANAALHAALLAPERINGLVLAGPTFQPATRTLPTLLRRALTTFRYEVPAELAAVGPSYLASGLLPLLRLIRSGQRDRPEDHIGKLQVPVLVVTGERDGFAPPDWARHLADLGSGQWVVLPGAHNGCFPYPEPADTALHHAVSGWTPAAGPNS